MYSSMPVTLEDKINSGNVLRRVSDGRWLVDTTPEEKVFEVTRKGGFRFGKVPELGNTQD